MDGQYLALVGIAGTLLGVLITSVFNLMNSRQSLKSEERKHRREIILKLGFEYWQAQTDFAKYANEKFHLGASIQPFETYALHMVKFLELVDENLINEDNVEEKLRELTDYSSRLNNFFVSVHNERKRAKNK
jgi:hypothetical protein